MSVRRLGSFLNGKIKFVWYRFLLSVVSVGGPGTIVPDIVCRCCTITGKSVVTEVLKFCDESGTHRCLL